MAMMKNGHASKPQVLTLSSLRQLLTAAVQIQVTMGFECRMNTQAKTTTSIHTLILVRSYFAHLLAPRRVSFLGMRESALFMLLFQCRSYVIPINWGRCLLV
jgi:hypothetical protein